MGGGLNSVRCLSPTVLGCITNGSGRPGEGELNSVRCLSPTLQGCITNGSGRPRGHNSVRRLSPTIPRCITNDSGRLGGAQLCLMSVNNGSGYVSVTNSVG